jgi:hypothetical protein
MIKLSSENIKEGVQVLSLSVEMKYAIRAAPPKIKN